MTSVIESMGTSEINVVSNLQTTKTIKKAYILDELDAMKKKLSFQLRNPAISIEGEAKNGVTINVLVKTSLFEYAKANLINDLQANIAVIDTKQTVVATANSKHSGVADVEYQLECKYVVNEHEHKVKITCYTTTCNILITNMGEKSEIKPHLGNKYNARYFAETFIEPFLLTTQKNFNNLDDIFVPLIKKEIERLEALEKQNHIYKEVISGLTKCAYKHCTKGKSGNLNLSNKGAYGKCSLCNEVEHFSCSKTKDWRKTNILNGLENYICTNCFAKHHGNLTLQKHLGVMHTSNEKPSPTENTVAIVHNTENLLIEDDDNEVTAQVYEITNNQEVRCVLCTETFPTVEELNVHIVSQHTQVNIFKCDKCSETFPREEDLNVHEAANHQQKSLINCEVCAEVFTSRENFDIHKTKHIQQSTLNCSECSEAFNSSDNLQLHRLTRHTQIECELCEFKSKEVQTMEMHKQDYHVLVHCNHCDSFLDSRILLKKHIEETHRTDKTSQEFGELLEENAKLKEELRAVKDNFERLSDIHRKQQEEFNEQKLIIEVDLAKTREEYKRMKTENEELKVRNDTLFKLGNIALKKYETNENSLNTKSIEDDTIEVVDDDDDIEMDKGLEVLAKNKARGFKRSDPTAPPCPTDRPLYSQVAADRSQADQGGHQQQRRQVPQEHREPQHHQAPRNSSNNRIRYCHYFNNGSCRFEEKYGRKCIFSHEKAPICSFDGKCNRKKCMFSHVKEKKSSNINKESFLGQRPQNITLQTFLQQVLGTIMNSQKQAQQNPGWQRRPYQ